MTATTRALVPSGRFRSRRLPHRSAPGRSICPPRTANRNGVNTPPFERALMSALPDQTGATRRGFGRAATAAVFVPSILFRVQSAPGASRHLTAAALPIAPRSSAPSRLPARRVGVGPPPSKPRSTTAALPLVAARLAAPRRSDSRPRSGSRDQEQVTTASRLSRCTAQWSAVVPSASAALT